MTGAVVLNYCTAAETLRNVGELRREGVALVVVVDNDSGPSDVAELESGLEGIDGVVLLRSQVNLGYAGGNNIGLRHLASAGVSEALVCNPDVRFPEGSVSRLVAARGEATLVAPLLLGPDGDIDGNGGWWSYRWGRGELNARRLGPEKRAGRLATFGGACFVVDLGRFLDLGLLPEDHFLYGEEADVVLRLARRGWSWRQVGVEVVHARGGSVGSDASWAARSTTAHRCAAESAVLLTRKYWPQWMALVVSTRLVMSVVQLARGDVDSARAIWSGLRSGLLGRSR